MRETTQSMMMFIIVIQKMTPRDREEYLDHAQQQFQCPKSG